VQELALDGNSAIEPGLRASIDAAIAMLCAARRDRS
jgi:hypothetical protein